MVLVSKRKGAVHNSLITYRIDATGKVGALEASKIAAFVRTFGGAARTIRLLKNAKASIKNTSTALCRLITSYSHLSRRISHRLCTRDTRRTLHKDLLHLQTHRAAARPQGQHHASVGRAAHIVAIDGANHVARLQAR